MHLTPLGHASCHLSVADLDIVIDPFWTGCPTHPEGFEQGLGKLDVIVLTHGHNDHVADAARLAQKYGALCFATYELANWLKSQGAEKIEPMGIGGTVAGPNGISVTFTQALHSSSFTGSDGSQSYTGVAAGTVIKTPEGNVYHAGDTDVFSDMALIQRLHGPRVGLLPIGDRFTMGVDGAALACNEFLDLEHIIPIHWGTFPLLTGDPAAFKAKVTRGTVHVLQPGQTLTV